MSFKVQLSDIKSFEGQVAIVTGGSSGIGHATALLLASKGAKVVVGDIHALPALSEDAKTNGVSPTNLSFIKTDVTSWASLLNLFKETIKKHGKVDIVVVNAGVDESDQPFEDKTDPETGDPVEPKWVTLKVNLNGSMMTTKLALHFFRKRKEGGAIVITGSRASYNAYNMPVYTATKHGLLGMMRGLRYHTPGWNIRINMVAPHVTFTNLIPPIAAGHYEKLGLYMQTSEDVALAIALLAQDPSYNGKTISISQGVYHELEAGYESQTVKDAMYGADDYVPANSAEFGAVVSAFTTRF